MLLHREFKYRKDLVSREVLRDVQNSISIINILRTVINLRTVKEEQNPTVLPGGRRGTAELFTEVEGRNDSF